MQPNTLIIEAIARQLCVTASYNRQQMLLAPHMLYRRHDALYVDCVTLFRDGLPPREVKLGSFKLDGLGGLALCDTPFARSPLFDPGLPRYVGTALFAVEGAERVAAA